VCSGGIAYEKSCRRVQASYCTLEKYGSKETSKFNGPTWVKALMRNVLHYTYAKVIAGLSASVPSISSSNNNKEERLTSPYCGASIDLIAFAFASKIDIDGITYYCNNLVAIVNILVKNTYRGITKSRIVIRSDGDGNQLAPHVNFYWYCGNEMH
jgi:hypothetical protein